MEATVKNYELDEILYLLLHNRTYRNLFLEKYYTKMNISRENVSNLQTIDTEELIATAKNIKINIVSGNINHEGGLKNSYPGVFESIKSSEINLDELIYEFIESIYFNDYKEVPFAGMGVCIEEAFFNFLIKNQEYIEVNINNKLLLQHDFFNAMHSILVINKNPNFYVKSELIKDNGFVKYSTLTMPRSISEALGANSSKDDNKDVTWIYASTAKHLIKGPINKLSLEIIEQNINLHTIQENSELIEKLNVEEDQIKSTILKLRELGILDE